MGREDQYQAAINFIYDAVVDASLWPAALTTLADAIGVAQIGFAAFDHRTHRFDALSPRIDPLLVASYKNYWAFRDAIWPRLVPQPIGELFLHNTVISSDEYSEWFRLAKLGLSIIGAKLPADAQISATIFAANLPDKDQISSEQALAFKAALPHFDRAFRVQRLLRVLDLDHVTAPEQLEHMGIGMILVDGTAKVLYANAWARCGVSIGCPR